MRMDAADFTTEEEDIVREFSSIYWNNVYNRVTNIPIDYIGENMPKSYSSSGIQHEVKDVKARIDELHEIAIQKAEVNISNTKLNRITHPD